MTDKPFLERWAGRKAAAQTPPEPAPEAEAEAPPCVPEAALAGPEARPLPEPITEEEIAALPPVESLTSASDIKAFLRPGVPALMKNAALRRMWLLTPAIRDHKDCAVDYAWDWNTPGGVPGDGGTLDPERVAQWVRQLASGETPGRKMPDPVEPAPAGDDHTGVASVSPDDSDEAEVASPADIAPDAPRPPEAPRPDPTTMARRRHGTARPG